MSVNQMPLTMVSAGEKVRIVGVRAGRGLNQRLADMGLTLGTTIEVITRHGMGPVLIDFRGSRLVLGFSAAQKIMVEHTGD